MKNFKKNSYRRGKKSLTNLQTKGDATQLKFLWLEAQIASETETEEEEQRRSKENIC